MQTEERAHAAAGLGVESLSRMNAAIQEIRKSSDETIPPTGDDEMNHFNA